MTNDLTFHVYRDLRSEWRWRLVAANGRIIADSAEGYTDRHNVAEAIARLQAAFTNGTTTVMDDQ